MIFISLITTAISCIFYGIIITAVIMAVLYFILRAINKGIVQTLTFYITGVVLAILLLIQTSMAIGAIKAKETADAAKQYVCEMMESYQGIVNTDESHEVIDAVKDEFPLIDKFVDLTALYGKNVADLPNTIHSNITDYLNTFIWHRVWWIMGIIIVACIIIVLFENNNITRTSSRRSSSRRNRSRGERISSARKRR